MRVSTELQIPLIMWENSIVNEKIPNALRESQIKELIGKIE